MRFFICIFLFSAAAWAESLPVYLSMTSLFPSGQYSRELLEENSQAMSLQYWYRIRTEDGRYGWIPQEHIETIWERTGHVKIRAGTAVYSQADLNSPAEVLATEANFKVLKNHGAWMEIRYQQKSGWILRENAEPTHRFVLQDLGRVKRNAPLKSAPLVNANDVGRIQNGQLLLISQIRLERWGLFKTKKNEAFWWQINSDFRPPKDHAPLSLSTKELMSRPLFDMAASPIHPYLKLASADGIYRTLDGQIWTSLKGLGQQNFPISFSANGRIFIGPYVSDDGGESLQNYVRWDQILKALRQKGLPTTEAFRIRGIDSINADGTHVRLTLSMGTQQEVRVESVDGGSTWSVTEKI